MKAVSFLILLQIGNSTARNIYIYLTVLITDLPLNELKKILITGGEYVGIVEYAPFQRISKKKKKKDPKCGTLESDPIYQEFIESLNKDPEVESQPKLEYSYPINDGNLINYFS